jgi:hypothetical protein
VVTLRLVAFCSLISVTIAFGIAPPLESVTVAEIVPVTLCAADETAKTIKIARLESKLTPNNLKLDIKNLLNKKMNLLPHQTQIRKFKSDAPF